MAPFAESKNRPTFVDYDVESLLVALSNYGDDDDDDNEDYSSSSSSSDDINNNNGGGEEQRDYAKEGQQNLDSSDDKSSSTSTTFQDSFSNSSFSSSTSTSITTTTTTTTQRRKSVTFNPQCSLATIPHWSSFTRQERRSMYMTSREYQDSKADARATADMLSEWGCEMRFGETSATPDNLEDDDICFLGLETHTTVGRTLRKSLRGRAARIVYENQHHNDNDVNDEDDKYENNNNKKVSNFFFSASAIAKRNKLNNNNMASQYAKISQSAISFAWMRALKNTDQIREYLESR